MPAAHETHATVSAASATMETRAIYRHWVVRIEPCGRLLSELPCTMWADHVWGGWTGGVGGVKSNTPLCYCHSMVGMAARMGYYWEWDEGKTWFMQSPEASGKLDMTWPTKAIWRAWGGGLLAGCRTSHAPRHLRVIRQDQPKNVSNLRLFWIKHIRLDLISNNWFLHVMPTKCQKDKQEVTSSDEQARWW